MKTLYTLHTLKENQLFCYIFGFLFEDKETQALFWAPAEKQRWEKKSDKNPCPPGASVLWQRHKIKERNTVKFSMTSAEEKGAGKHSGEGR